MRIMTVSSAIVAATVYALPQAAVAQAFGKPFCLQASSGALECGYDTMALCLQAAQSRSPKGTCAPRPGTTGAGGLDAPRGAGPNSLDRPSMPQR